MDKNVPPGAAILLDFIGDIEAPKGYGTIYANKQNTLPKPLTSMTVDEVIASGPGWTRAHKSSAAGRYQFMNRTLKDLKAEIGLRGSQTFDANLQDRLAFHLLKRRGYDSFMAGKLSVHAFGKLLAQEWASLPVLADTKGGSRDVKRGQSYYAGDGLNKSLVKPERVEEIIALAKKANGTFVQAPTPKPQPIPVQPPETPAKGKSGLPGWVVAAAVLAAAVAVYFIFIHR